MDLWFWSRCTFWTAHYASMNSGSHACLRTFLTWTAHIFQSFGRSQNRSIHFGRIFQRWVSLNELLQLLVFCIIYTMKLNIQDRLLSLIICATGSPWPSSLTTSIQYSILMCKLCIFIRKYRGRRTSWIGSHLFRLVGLSPRPRGMIQMSKMRGGSLQTAL